MVVVEYEQLHCLKKNYCLLFYTVILKQLLDMNELNKNIYGLKILTILETLKIYKLMLFTTRDFLAHFSLLWPTLAQPWTRCPTIDSNLLVAA